MLIIVFSFLSFWLTGSQPDASGTQDSLQIVSSGVKNQVTINSMHVASGNFQNDTIAVSGQIIQNGASNRIKISTATPPKNDKRINQHINITQTGKNNSIKINSK